MRATSESPTTRPTESSTASSWATDRRNWSRSGIRRRRSRSCAGGWKARTGNAGCRPSPWSVRPPSASSISGRWTTRWVEGRSLSAHPLSAELALPPESRPMSYSRGEISTFVMPHMQNVLGDLFGGHLMALVDQAAAVAAIRHAGGPAVTKSIDRLDFHHPIPVGALVTCTSTVDFVGNSSMDITVQVYAEKVSTGERRHTHTAHVVFVAIDEKGKPKRVPRLIPETDQERERYARAEAHRQQQKRS